MDGEEMKAKDKPKLSKPSKVSLIRRSDRTTIVLFIALFIASIVAYWVLMTYYEFTVYTGLPTMAIPFFVIGAVFYVVNRRYYAMMFIAAVSIISFFILPSSVLFILYLLVCAEGVAQMIEVIQRLIFYDIMTSVQNVNVKTRPSLFDRIVVFFFNVPVDLDTRNLTIDMTVSRNKIPWMDMVNSMLLALLFCMFIWIYVFLNPSISIGTTGVPIYTFTIILYLSMIVIPWTIFNTMNARVVTEYRDFSLYSGFMETFKRMFLPIFAALLFLVGALFAGPDQLYYVAMSLAMIVAMTVFTSVMYFTSNEMDVVGDILDRWSEFQPTDIYSSYGKKGERSSLKDHVPGTPRRDPEDCFMPIQKS